MLKVKTFLLVSNYGYHMTSQEQIEDIIKVSSKGQIVIPREVRKKLGVKGGEKLLVLTRDDEIVLRKTRELTMDDIARKISKTVQEEHIDVDKLVAEAVEWARKSK
jgi:AbrB family looped-hinge helix DNA binding protein